MAVNNRTLEIFSEICRIPHPSHHEAALRDFLKSKAEAAGLACRCDAAGNLRIDRAAAPEYAAAPAVILQGHLDMVPQKNAGTAFDFLTDPIRPVEREGYWYADGGTTLGADNGVGVAAAMSLLLDGELRCGPLAAVFTVCEEVGLDGALGIDPALLAGDILLNLDSEEEGEFCIGCAGGARLTTRLDLEFAPPSGRYGVRLALTGMKGGHSGMDIDGNRGNALKLLAGFLERNAVLEVAEFQGGSLDNAIPREAFARAATDNVDALARKAAEFTRATAPLLDVFPDFRLEVSPAERPPLVWTPRTLEAVLTMISEVPDGALAFDETLGIVRTSSNLASVQLQAGRLLLRSSQRSLNNLERLELTGEISALFARHGGVSQADNAYPGWEPRPESPLLLRADAVYRRLAGRPPLVKVIHAGLECGILGSKNPHLDMLSFGPTLENPHSPSERLKLDTVEPFYAFLEALVREIAGA